MSKTKLSIVLPARNEEQLIQKTVSNIVTYLKKKKYDYEVLIVVNGSDDNTEKIARKITSYNKHIKVLKSKPGYGFALRTGLRKSIGDFIIIYSVDFFDLNLIDFIDINMYGQDLIIGSKRDHWSKDSRPITRKVVSTIFNSYLRAMHGFAGSDTHGIKLMNRQLLKTVLPKCKTQGGIFDTELVLRSQKENFKIVDFPVDVKEVRPSRFKNRIFSTPIDIYQLFKSLN